MSTTVVKHHWAVIKILALHILTLSRTGVLHRQLDQLDKYALSTQVVFLASISGKISF